MDQAKLMSLGIAAAILYAGYKYGNPIVKTMALGVAGGIVARQIPYLNTVA
ncbi:MAG: hypothetical protein JWQ72_2650 [Polaromonas sp.]|nr:hypothetical protein [Polaromonas sp.]